MAHQLADRRDVEFVLHEQLNLSDLSNHETYGEFNKKTIDLVISEARNLALKEVLPTNAPGDQSGCTLENGHVQIPDEFKRVWELYRDGEWIATSEDPGWGGQGMPHALSMACTEYLSGANMAMYMYVALTHGAANLVEAFGSQGQKEKYLRKMYSGEWTGTMLLTEPGAGSDVGALTTTATPNADGTYSIKGNKIFISGGEHDMVENIVHPVLARIEGAPEGTKGISLFTVPKYRVADDGSVGEFNDVVCTGIEHKMGIHGNCTCSLALGEKGECVGELLGEPNKGMRAMFQMMNEARLFVGIQGLSVAGASYANALTYAKERVQGPNLMTMMDKNPPAVPIIQHPDIRRQLIAMKANVEAMRSLLFYIGYCSDLKKVSDSEDEKERLQGIIDVLIPIGKGYVTDRSYDVCSHGMQVYGGYGFIEEYPQAQLLRDCRITMIYEGTNGIQAMDLLGRKLGMKKGKAVMDLMAEMQKTIAGAREVAALAPLADELEKAVGKLGEVAMYMGKTAMSTEVMNAFANAHPFMTVTGDVVFAWMHLWRALTATAGLEKAKKRDKDFYGGVLASAAHYIQTELPVAQGRMRAILKGSDAAMTIPETAFFG
ncbi:acyl-CoA dehydrogenase [Desulfoluna spongiiphila]|uniref:acyl-CoA dehydrogenase n=1 Tax=Desulfoluna spongiiphila TaxID=419481 RepID=UPI00125AEA74|nr:acyl-CoA dehydrogenase [Desulfoluna spongiiphila]VVS95681.1 acyl-coa dehydrogenase/oxidase c-terminal [Desulfoluna spongiiphila]